LSNIPKIIYNIENTEFAFPRQKNIMLWHFKTKREELIEEIKTLEQLKKLYPNGKITK